MRRLNCGRKLPRPVTVVVLTWNAVDETARLLRSLHAHPLPANASLVVVDNGSTDHTVDLLLPYDEIELILNPENVGYTRAVNQALARTTGDVVLLNNDTAVLHPCWLHRLQETADSAPDVGIVGCRLLANDDLLGGGGRVVHAGGWIDPRTGDGGNITCRLDEFRDVREALFVTFGCAYIKRSVVDRLGPLDERYFAYCEDSDYCLQAREAGFRVLMDGRVNLLHSEGASGRANGVDLAALHRASGRQFWEKWGDKLRAVCPPVQSKDGPDREPLLA